MESRAGSKGAAMVVIDTLTRAFSTGMPGRANMSGRQSALNIHLSEVARDAVLHGRAYILTNRVTFGAKGVTWIGGLTVENLVHTPVLLEKDGPNLRARLQSGQVARTRISRKGVE